MWLIWGALTDWLEMLPEETAQAEDAMLRAASEWLAIEKQDASAREAYFNRWIYDELEYPRPA